MKALELTVYPLWENDLDGSCYTGTTIDDVRNVGYEVHRKRLTGPELAAEYQRGEFDYERAFHGMRYLSGNWNPDKFATYERRAVIERFATLPHAADKDYQ